MSQPHYAPDMERPRQGSVKRARERALAGGLPPPRPPKNDIARPESPPGQLSPPPRRHMPPSHRNVHASNQSSTRPPSRPPPQPPLAASSRPGRPRMPPGADGKGGPVISRPTQAPHWPLPPGSPLRVDNSDRYRAQPGYPRQAPPRPQRPSRIPSMVDQSRPQEPTPVFFNPQVLDDEQRESSLSHQPSTASRLTASSVGTIPDFPVPATSSAAPPTAPPPVPTPSQRRSANLGPPPANRRGVASSYYSVTSNVSPIPEESLRSPGSYGSSFTMPSNWNANLQAPSPLSDAFYDDSMTIKSRDSGADDSSDESKLVRSASIGKKGKASLVDTKSVNTASAHPRPSPSPVQRPFNSGTAYFDASTSSSEQTLPHKHQNVENGAMTKGTPPVPGLASTEDGMPESRIPAAVEQGTGATSLSTRRPLKLDIDAVRNAEARGSLTSLPDLIKRATRLAAMIDTGKRPASRFDNLSDFLEKSDNDAINDRHVSGLSDMLNAFPPPAQPPNNGRRSRGSWFRTTSWPLIPVRQAGVDGVDSKLRNEASESQAEKKKTRAGRRCCGMPPWAFVLLVILFLCVIAVAIVIPLQFFVFKTLGNHEEPQAGLDKCRSDLICQNGGTNVLSQGTCTCICTNGFSGSDCTEQGGSTACTTTTLVSSDSGLDLEDVTIGNALPRLIADASSNFSIPLSGTTILARINSGDISCLTQNALVTFDGRSIRMGEASSEIKDMGDDSDAAKVAARAVADLSSGTMPTQVVRSAEPETLETATGSLFIPRTTVASDEPRPTATETPSIAYNVTEEALDFARVAVLFVLQEQSIQRASDAQTRLERFFNRASQSDQLDPVTELDAKNITVGGDNSIDLVNYRMSVGDGLVGGDVAD